MSASSNCTMANAGQLPPEPAAYARHGLVAFLRHIAQRIRRRKLAEQEDRIGRFIADNGGRLTDNLEREISRRFATTAGG